MVTRPLAVAILLATAGCYTTYSDGGDPMDPSPCSASFDPQPGELGVLRFAHDRGALVCAFGCGLGEPLAEESVSRIAVYADGEVPSVSASSDNPAVAEFAVSDEGVDVTTHAPGTARLELRDESGALVDAVAVVVKPVSAIEARDDLAIMVGGSTYVNVTLRDELGCTMLGIGGVTYTLSGGITESEATIADAITDLLFGFLEGATDEGFRVDAVSVGSGRLTLAAPSGATKDIPVDVVDASSVARVTLTSPVLPLEVATGQSIDAAAFTSDDRVIESPLCAWTLTPTSGSPMITDEGRDSLYVAAAAAAAATVACVVGSASASLDVTWE